MYWNFPSSPRDELGFLIIEDARNFTAAIPDSVSYASTFALRDRRLSLAPICNTDKCHCQRGGLPASVDMFHLNGVEKSSSIEGRSTERVNRWNKDPEGTLLTRQGFESRLTLVADLRVGNEAVLLGFTAFMNGVVTEETTSLIHPSVCSLRARKLVSNGDQPMTNTMINPRRNLMRESRSWIASSVVHEARGRN